jgi:hypothetical protein
MADDDGDIDIYPLILSKIRSIKNNAKSKIYIYQTADTPCGNFEMFCNWMGLGCLAPSKTFGKLLVYLQLCIHQTHELLDNEGWIEENLDLDKPLSIEQIVDMYIKGIGYDYISTDVVKIVSAEERVAIVQDKQRVFFSRGDREKPYAGHQRAIIYQTPEDIADDVQQLIDEHGYSLIIPKAYILQANHIA